MAIRNAYNLLTNLHVCHVYGDRTPPDTYKKYLKNNVVFYETY